MSDYLNTSKLTRGSREYSQAAMQADLGIHRLEQLLEGEDEPRGPRQRLNPPVTQSRNTTRQGIGIAGSDELASRWTQAIKAGAFEDSDAAAVRGLDPLDNGRAHAVHGPPHRHGGGQSNPLAPSRHVPRAPIYDPANPGYGRTPEQAQQPKHSQPKGQPRADYSNHNGPMVGRLGGVVPEGGQIKVFSTPYANASREHSEAVPQNPLATSRGHDKSTRNGITSGRDLDAELSTRGAARDQGFGVPPLPSTHIVNPLLAGRGRREPVRLYQAPAAQPAARLHERSVLGNRPSVQPRGSANTGIQPVDVSVSKLAVPLKAPLSSDLPEDKKRTPSSNTAPTNDWIPPHLRKGTGSQPSATQSSAVPQQSSPRSPQVEAAVNGFDKNKKLFQPTHVRARVIFYRGGVCLLGQDKNGFVSHSMPAHMFIYEHYQNPVCIWELEVLNNFVVLGDLRELEKPLGNASTVILRRKARNIPNSVIQSTSIKFDNIAQAQNFIREVEKRRVEYRHSLQPIFFERSETLPRVEDTTMHRPAIGSIDGPELKLDTPKLGEPGQNETVAEPEAIEEKTPLAAATAVVNEGIRSGWSDAGSDPQPASPTIKVASPLGGDTTVSEPIKIESGWLKGEDLTDAQPASPTIKVESPMAADTQLAEPNRDEAGLLNDEVLIDISCDFTTDFTVDQGNKSGNNRDELEGLTFEPSVSSCLSPRRSDTELKTPNEKTFDVVEPAGAQNVSHLEGQLVSMQKAVDDGTSSEKVAHANAVADVLNAFRDPKAVRDICVGKDLAIESIRFLAKITSSNYGEITLTANHLTGVLGSIPTSSEDTSETSRIAAYQASLLYLKGNDEFISLSRDDQKNILAVVHANVHHGKSRLIRSPAEIRALRFCGAPCPQAVTELNLEIQYWRDKHPRSSPKHQEPQANYNPSLMAKNQITNREFLYNHSTIDATTSQAQAPEVVVAYTPRSVSNQSSTSSKAAAKTAKGLGESRWAERVEEDAEKMQPHASSL